MSVLFHGVFCSFYFLVILRWHFFVWLSFIFGLYLIFLLRLLSLCVYSDHLNLFQDKVNAIAVMHGIWKTFLAFNSIFHMDLEEISYWQSSLVSYKAPIMLFLSAQHFQSNSRFLFQQCFQKWKVNLFAFRVPIVTKEMKKMKKINNHGCS